MVNKILLLSSGGKVNSIEKTSNAMSNTDKDPAISVTNDGTTVTATSVGYKGVRSELPIEKGKYYMEVKLNSAVRLDASHLGVIEKERTLNYGTSLGTFTGARTYRGNGTKFTPSSSSYGTAWALGDVISMLIDMDLGELRFWKNGVDLGVASSDLKTMSNVYLLAMPYGANDSLEFNFGDKAFIYNTPNDYNPLRKILINQLPSQSEQNFITYGMDSPVQFDVLFTDKNYILSKEDSEIRENVRSVQINRKPLSIKFN